MGVPSCLLLAFSILSMKVSEISACPQFTTCQSRMMTKLFAYSADLPRLCQSLSDYFRCSRNAAVTCGVEGQEHVQIAFIFARQRYNTICASYQITTESPTTNTLQTSAVPTVYATSPMTTHALSTAAENNDHGIASTDASQTHQVTPLLSRLTTALTSQEMIGISDSSMSPHKTTTSSSTSLSASTCGLSTPKLCNVKLMLSQFINECEEINNCNRDLESVLSTDPPTLCRGLLGYIPCVQAALERCPDTDLNSFNEIVTVVSAHYNSSNCTEVLKEVRTSTESSNATAGAGPASLEPSGQTYTERETSPESSKITAYLSSTRDFKTTMPTIQYTSSTTKDSVQLTSPRFGEVSSSTNVLPASKFTTYGRKDTSVASTGKGIIVSTPIPRSTLTFSTRRAKTVTSGSTQTFVSFIPNGAISTKVEDQEDSDKLSSSIRPLMRTSEMHHSTDGLPSTGPKVTDLVTLTVNPTGSGTRSSAKGHQETSKMSTLMPLRTIQSTFPTIPPSQSRSSPILKKQTTISSTSKRSTSATDTLKTEFYQTGISSRQEVCFSVLAFAITTFLLLL